MGCCEDAGEPGVPTGRWVTSVLKDGCGLVVSYSDGTSESFSLDCNQTGDGDPGNVPEPVGTNKCGVATTLSNEISTQWANLAGAVVPAPDVYVIAGEVAAFIANYKWPAASYPALLAYATTTWASGVLNNGLGDWNVNFLDYKEEIKQAIYCCLPDTLEISTQLRLCARDGFYDPLSAFYLAFQTFWLMFPLELSKKFALDAASADPANYLCDPCAGGTECTAFTREWTPGNPWTILPEAGWEFVTAGAANFYPDWWQGFWSLGQSFASAIYNGAPATVNCTSGECASMGVIYTLPAPCTIELLDSRSGHQLNNTVGRAWYVEQNGIWTRIKTYNRAINGAPIGTAFTYVAGVDGSPLTNVSRVALVLTQGGSRWILTHLAINEEIV